MANLDFQKLLFLYCQELGNESPYDFVPYRFGAFSFTCYADRRKLIDGGFLEAEESKWQLTANGTKVASYLRSESIDSFVEQYSTLRGERLISETYVQYPYYAIHSEVANEVLRGDKVALGRIEEARPISGLSPLLTIGYQGQNVENYLNALIKASVTVLCDVRQNAISRKYGFSKSTLSNACSGIGIRYVHIPELGISAERRRKIKSLEDRRRLLQEYAQHDLPKQLSSLATILEWIDSGEYVALTCFERDVSSCHRGRVATELERKWDKRIPVEHL